VYETVIRIIAFLVATSSNSQWRLYVKCEDSRKDRTGDESEGSEEHGAEVN
jgi:hypothetical protein